MKRKWSFMVDSFSGPASELKGARRTSENVLRVLADHPRVSTWDMSEHPWLHNCISDLKLRGLIAAQQEEPYPWHRYQLTASGRAALAPAQLQKASDADQA